MENKGTNKKGFTLIIVIIGLALISILGVTIVGITTSTFKMTKVDSRSQSTYYIAEAGVNYMINEINNEIENLNKEFNTSEEFFKHIEDEFTKEKYNLDSFNMNNGEKPKAIIDVSLTGENLGTRIYKIKSEGEIGNSNKTVSSIISIGYATIASDLARVPGTFAD